MSSMENEAAEVMAPQLTRVEEGKIHRQVMALWRPVVPFPDTLSGRLAYFYSKLKIEASDFLSLIRDHIITFLTASPKASKAAVDKEIAAVNAKISEETIANRNKKPLSGPVNAPPTQDLPGAFPTTESISKFEKKLNPEQAFIPKPPLAHSSVPVQDSKPEIQQFKIPGAFPGGF